MSAWLSQTEHPVELLHGQLRAHHGSSSEHRSVLVPCNPALIRLLAAQRALMLQGPVGPFFDRLAHWLHQHGIASHRVVFQGGDEADCQALTPIRYTGTLKDWPAQCQQLLEQHGIDCIVLFGQARAYHAAAIQVARNLGIAIVVLEEGYFRPGYVTIELDGVNGHSTTLQRYAWDPSAPGPAVQLSLPDNVHGQFWTMARHAMRHYWAMRQGRDRYPHYIHHRPDSVWHYSRYWMISWARKGWHYRRDHAHVKRLSGYPYYFVPLQHDGDSQLTLHSPFRENTHFITEVLESFADHAPAETQLVFRQHPMSRGSRGHGGFIRSLAQELGIGHRVDFLVEGHTPTLVRNALGVVLINSTVGLQTLLYKRPLKVMGSALFNRPGITAQEELDAFWTRLPLPEPRILDPFLQQLRHLTQLPCNVYGHADEPLNWKVL